MLSEATGGNSMATQSPKQPSGGVVADDVVDETANTGLPAEYSRYQYEDSIAFGVKLSAQDGRRVSDHSHDNIQISVPLRETLVEARWRMSNGKRRRSYAQHGHVLVVPPRQIHAIAWNNRAYFVNFHIGSDTASDYGRAFLQSVTEAGNIHVVEDPFLTALAENIVIMGSRAESFDINLLQAIKFIIEAHMIKTYAPEILTMRPNGRLEGATPLPGRAIGAPTSLAPWQLRKILTVLESDLRRDFSVDELAKLLNLSAGHFSRAFRASTQLSPHQWIIRHRIETAMDMLRQTDLLIGDIATSCGFSEQGHFTRKFKQITGQSPAAWRRNNRVP